MVLIHVLSSINPAFNTFNQLSLANLKLKWTLLLERGEKLMLVMMVMVMFRRRMMMVMVMTTMMMMTVLSPRWTASRCGSLKLFIQR